MIFKKKFFRLINKFHADFKSVEKVLKNEQKKSDKQNKFDEHE